MICCCWHTVARDATANCQSSPENPGDLLLLAQSCQRCHCKLPKLREGGWAQRWQLAFQPKGLRAPCLLSKHSCAVARPSSLTIGRLESQTSARCNNNIPSTLNPKAPGPVEVGVGLREEKCQLLRLDHSWSLGFRVQALGFRVQGFF